MEWTREEIEYVLTKREEGKSYGQIAKDFAKDHGTLNFRSRGSIRHCVETYSGCDLEHKLNVGNLKSIQRLKNSKSKIVKENNVILKHLNTVDEFTEILVDNLKNNPPVLYEPITFKRKKATKRAIVAHLSDMHFHSFIDHEEMGDINKYTNIEESRRLAFFTREIAEYKKQHRDETDLVLAINGDILQGVIHDTESTPAITTQVSASIHLLSQSISYLATQYKNVRVVCTVGNHERMMHKSNKGRQSRQKWDNFATIVYVGLKYALKEHGNVSFEIPITPYAYIDILGHKFLITHSDTVVNMGYPGKSINVQNAKNKINDLKEGIGHIDVVMCGHVHVQTKQILNNGVVLMTNGSMSGVDEFALSIGITSNMPTQQLFEVTKEYCIGDSRDVYLLEADTEEELDEIIEPFRGKF